MWVRKDELEINAENLKESKSFLEPILFAAGVLIVLFVGDLMGLSRWIVSKPLKGMDLLYHQGYNVIISVILFLVGYYYQRFIIKNKISRHWNKNSTYCCLNCEACDSEKSNKCKCGGEKEKIENLKWID